MSLLACPSCTRHVRRSESMCPFCKGALSFEPAPERPAPRARLGRAATFAFGAALSTNLAGCPTDSTADTGAIDTGRSDTGIEIDTGGIGPLYGGAPDTGPVADTGTEEDTGGIGPLYGGAPDTGVGNDAGDDAGGGIGPLYGAPPA